MGLITALSAAGLAAGLAITGVHAAAAATPASVTLPSGGVLEQRVTKFCSRVPELLERVDKAQQRISEDAETKGSLAWLKAKQAAQQEKGHQRVVRRLDRRIERRTDRLAKLPTVKQKLTAAQSECATLDLPAPSPSSSS